MTQAAPRRNQRRQKKRRPKPTSRDILAGLFMAAWICVLMQGALRKWIFPGVTVLYLIQDVPLLIAYIYAFRKGLVWGGKVAWTCIVLAIVVSIQTMLQFIMGDLTLRMGVIGLHHYIFYLPILFLAPVCYNHKHRLRFLRWNLLIILPMAMIAALQSRAPKGAWINRTSAGDDTAFGLEGDVVRASGTFNFSMTYDIWCGMAVALVLGEWLIPPGERSFKSKALLLVCTLGAVLATLVSGARSAVALAAMGFLGGLAAVVVTRNFRLILRFTSLLILVPVLGTIAYMVAPGSLQGVLDRFTAEGTEQNLTARITHGFVGFATEPKFSLLGAGTGYGIPAANPTAGTSFAIILSEHDTIRIVQELGTFTGSAVVLARYAAGVLLLFAAFKCLSMTRGHSFPHAVPLAFAVAPTLMIGEVIRSAPVIATQAFFCVALVAGAILFRREPLDAAPVQLSEMR
jgi:hypothetical protein